jgi:hypothetical protein
MNRKLLRWTSVSVLVVGAMFGAPRLAATASPTIQEIAQGMMGGGMMQGGMSGPGMMGGGDMRSIRELFASHNQIRRTVEEIPGGIRSVTESDNPQVASLIQSHVPSMYQHIDHGQSIPMIMMSSTLPVMAQNADRYQRHFQLTPKGIVVTEISNDPGMVAVIRDHAREVSGFVTEGMPAMMKGMMR